MTYATRQDLESRFGSDEIARLAGDPDGARIDRTIPALADANALAESHVAVRYALPLPAGDWPILRECVCDIARLNLYDHSPLDEVSEAASRARGKLGRIAGGKLLLTGADGAEPPLRVAARFAAAEPQMTRTALRGF